jgi:hypothetical protein
MESEGTLPSSDDTATSLGPEPDQSNPQPYATFWRYISILSTHLRHGLPREIFPSGFPTKTVYAVLLSPYVPLPRQSHSSVFDPSYNSGYFNI